MVRLPRSVEPRTVILVLIAFGIVVSLAAMFGDCDGSGCRGSTVTGWGGGGFVRLCVEGAGR